MSDFHFRLRVALNLTSLRPRAAKCNRGPIWDHFGGHFGVTFRTTFGPLSGSLLDHFSDHFWITFSEFSFFITFSAFLRFSQKNVSTAYWIIFRSTKSDQIDDFWWFLSSIEYRSNMIFDVFNKNRNFRVFQQHLIRLPFDRSPKSSETSHSRCCEICYWQQDVSDEPKRRIRRKNAEIVRFFVSAVSGKSFRSLISA